VFRPLAINVGLRYASSRRSFVSFISAVAIGGLVLSVAVLLLVTSVMNGFEREMRQRILGLVPHAQLRGSLASDGIEDLIASVRTVEGVTGAAPYVQENGLLAANGASSGVVFHGIEPSSFRTISNLGQFVFEGSLEALQPGSFGVVLSRALAERLSLAAGDSVMAVLPEGSVTLVGLIPRQKRLRVAGIFDTHSEFDARGVYIALADAQRMFRLSGVVSGLSLRVSDVFAVATVAAAAADRIGSDRIYPVTWMRSHGNLYRAIGFQRAMMFLLLSLLVAVAAFNLVSALIMVVNQRQGDVAVLRTLGGDSRTIVGSFVTLGATIGVIGVVIGVALGAGAALLVEDGYRLLHDRFHVDLMSQYFVTYLPSEIRMGDVLLVTGVALALSLLSTLYPAWRAAALEPAEVLRHE